MVIHNDDKWYTEKLCMYIPLNCKLNYVNYYYLYNNNYTNYNKSFSIDTFFTSLKTDLLNIQKYFWLVYICIAIFTFLIAVHYYSVYHRQTPWNQHKIIIHLQVGNPVGQIALGQKTNTSRIGWYGLKIKVCWPIKV